MKTARIPQPYMEEHWFQRLEAAVSAHPRGIAGVSVDMAVSPAALSLVLGGKYPAKTDRLAAKVLDHYDRHYCPHLVETLTRAVCRAYAVRPAPTSSPREMRHWRACQACPHNPGKKEPS